MAEAGVPNVVVSSWFALFVPAGTPKEAIAWLNKQANDAFSAPEVREQFARQGVTLPLGTPDALGAHVAAEYKKWGEVVRKANITLPHRLAAPQPNTADIMSHHVHLVGSVPLPDAPLGVFDGERGARAASQDHSRRRDRRAARLDHLARARVLAASGLRAVGRDLPASRRAGAEGQALPAQGRRIDRRRALRQHLLRRPRHQILRRVRRAQAPGRGAGAGEIPGRSGARPFGDLALRPGRPASGGRQALQRRGASARSTRSPPKSRTISSRSGSTSPRRCSPGSNAFEPTQLRQRPSWRCRRPSPASWSGSPTMCRPTSI